MTRSQEPSCTQSPAHGKHRGKWWRSPLKREIALALLIKLALLIAIKTVFFSHPLAKQEAAARLGAMIDSASPDYANAHPSPHTDKMESP